MWYEIEIKTLINNKFMLIKKCSKSINLCINLVFIVFILEINLYIFIDYSNSWDQNMKININFRNKC